MGHLHTRSAVTKQPCNGWLGSWPTVSEEVVAPAAAPRSAVMLHTSWKNYRLISQIEFTAEPVQPRGKKTKKTAFLTLIDQLAALSRCDFAPITVDVAYAAQI